jgi:hypothetical protein
MVTFTIGSGWDREEFMVHLEVANFSPVIQAELATKHSREKKVFHLGDQISGNATRLLLQGLYGQELSVLQSLDPKSKDKEIAAAEFLQENKDLMQMWVIAEKLKLPELQNMALLAINTMITHGDVPSKAISFLYDITTPGAKLRYFIVAACVGTLSLGNCTLEERRLFPAEFLFDLASLLSELVEEFQFSVAHFFVPTS